MPEGKQNPLADNSGSLLGSVGSSGSAAPVTHADKDSCDGWWTAHRFSARMPAKSDMELLPWQNNE